MQTRGMSVCTQILITVGIITNLIGFIHGQNTYCVHSQDDSVKFFKFEGNSDDDNGGYVKGVLMDGNKTEKCPPSWKYCYAVWQEKRNVSHILAQGCWETATEFDCNEGECISNKPSPKALNNTKFCCCSGHRCNENVTDGFIYEEAEPSNGSVEQASYDSHTVILAVVVMCTVGFILLAVCVGYRVMTSSLPIKKPHPDAVYLMEPPPPSSPLFNIQHLKIKEPIGRGRYGHVYRGTFFNQTLAVKIFAAQNRNYYLNERYIYCLPFMDHPCLLKLMGAEERMGADDRPEFLLALSYTPIGCLQDFLTNNTFDWFSFCKMAQNITQGLAHLHTEIKKDGRVKMCVAHRDLTSRNILVKPDGSCMLCDFGFAICISGSKYYVSGEEQIAESTSLSDVGTLRYMAPEVLEGAVNLRDCESSLKQIDVYALGLVLWEIATRCTDLFQGVEVPEYKLPFVAEIGTHPTIEQMQVLVAKHKARPLFPDIWKDSNPAVRSLKETIDDCWDQDAEARLTALCVEERLSELPMLWERHKAGTTIPGVSPTVNPTSMQNNVSVPTVAVVSSTNSWNKGPGFDLTVIKGNSELSTPNNGLGSGRFGGDCSLSEHTAETSIPVSPSELTPNSCVSCSSNSGGNMKNLSANNNNVVGGLRVTVPLQPYQGKNPIMERNLIIHQVEEMAVSGNSLVEKKDTNNVEGLSYEGDVFNSLLPTETSESNALVTNDELGHSARPCNPIPYVQNAVHTANTVPKQQNVPGNGHSLQASPKSGINRKEESPRFLMGLKNLFRFSKSASSSRSDLSPVSVPLIKDKSALIINVPKHQNSSVKHVPNGGTKPKEGLETEVYIIGSDDEFCMTQTIVRPVANKQVYSQTVSCENESEISNNLRSPKTFMGANGVVQSQTHPFLTSDHIDSEGGNSLNNNSIKVVKRPNTLPVARLASRKNSDMLTNMYLDISDMTKKDDDFCGVETSANHCEDGFQVNSKATRSSSCDDRYMAADSETQLQSVSSLDKDVTTPLTSSSSVPQSINVLYDADASSLHNAT